MSLTNERASTLKTFEDYKRLKIYSDSDIYDLEDKDLNVLKRIFERFLHPRDLLRDSSINLNMGSAFTGKILGIIRVREWIAKEVEDQINGWDKRASLNYTELIDEIERVRKEQKDKFDALEAKFKEEATIPLEVKLDYHRHFATYVDDEWNPLEGSPGFSADNHAVEEILQELVVELKDGDEDVTYAQVVEKHMDGLEQAFEEAVESAIEEVWDEATDIASNIRPEIIEVLTDSIDHEALGLTKKQLATVLELSTNVVDASAPIYGLLDDITSGLGKGFSDVSKDLIVRSKNRLTALSIKYIYDHEDLRDLRDRLTSSMSAKDRLDEHRMYIVCAKAVKIIVETKIKALQEKLEDYVVNNDDYMSVMNLDAGITIPAPKSLTDTLPDHDLEEYHVWLAEAENYYKIFPEHGTAKLIVYSSSNNPDTKTARYDMEPVFAALRDKGMKAHDTFSKYVCKLKLKVEEKKFEQAQQDLAKAEAELKEHSDALSATTFSKKEKKKNAVLAEGLEKKVVKASGNLEEALLKLNKQKSLFEAGEASLAEVTI